MSNLGAPVIVSGPNGLMQLAHRTKFGLQTSIENFCSPQEAREFLMLNKMRAVFELDVEKFCGLREAREFLALHKMRAVFVLDVGELNTRECDLLVALEGGPEMISDVMVKLTTTAGRIGGSFKKFSNLGLGSVVSTGEKRRDDVVALSEQGMIVRSRLLGVSV